MTELRWAGKYDEAGRLCAPLRVALPFQTVETVNESAADRQKTLDLFASGRPSEWRNRLIWGDKKYVLPSLLPELAGKVDLIYIDPPFDTGADFSFTTTIPEADATLTKAPGAIEQKAYRDTWGRGLDSYLHWFYETAVLLRELLSENGSIYVHLDWHVGHYAKVILDEIFGYERFQNEIIWQRTDSHNDALKKYGSIHDTIFWYGKSDKIVYHPDAARTGLSEAALAEYSLLELPNGEVVSFKGNEEREGRRFKVDDATWRGSKNRFTWRGATPSAQREWGYTSPEEMDAALERGDLYLRNPEKGTARCKKSYLDKNKGLLLQDIWTDAGRMKGGSRYATEKPEALLERIIRASSNEGDLVLDCFCGSGTTAAVAEKLGRRWVTCDLGRFAVHTARKRLLAIPGVRPFAVQNLGKYERQRWQAHEFGDNAAAVQAAYRRFLLELYRATPLENGSAWLHGVKAGRLVHVGAVDGPVTAADVAAIAAEFRALQGTGAGAPTTNGVDVLGWDFAFEMNEVARQQAEAARLNVRFVRIPREVMEKRAAVQGDVHFYELGALGVAATVQGRTVTVRLTDFVMPLDSVPDEVQQTVTHWSQWIDYWAVDWDHQDDTFHNMWQAYRTKAAPKLPVEAVRENVPPGRYRVVVKVMDLLGNDTTRVVEVEVAS